MDDDDSSSEDQRAPLPTLAEVLYCPPNPDGSHKMCGNCFAYATGKGQCYIHDPTLVIRPTSICGYHVFCFAPLKMFTSLVKMQPVKPEFSGLQQTEHGVDCDGCKYYAETGEATDAGEVSHEVGECLATCDSMGMPGRVEAKGACARWKRNAEKELVEFGGGEEDEALPVGDGGEGDEDELELED
jgi:hypothetical protein